MNIIWQYLDKRAAAVNALKDYGSMKYIIDNTGAEIADVHVNMGGVRSPGFDGMTHAHDPQAAEERIIKGIDEIDVLKERYRQAVEYMDWFKPAWEELSEDEKYVLEIFYQDDGTQTKAVYTVCDHYQIERSSAYNKKEPGTGASDNIVIWKSIK